MGYSTLAAKNLKRNYTVGPKRHCGLLTIQGVLSMAATGGEGFEETLTDLDRYEVKLSLNWGC